MSVISAASLPQPANGFTFTITHFFKATGFPTVGLIRLFFHAYAFRFRVNAGCFPAHLKASIPKNGDCLVWDFGVFESLGRTPEVCWVVLGRS